MAETARMSKKADKLATILQSITGKDKKLIIELALERYYHQERMRAFNESYSELRASKDWFEEENELQVLEGTLSDGIDEE